MHMGDSLLSLPVGATFLGISGIAVVLASRRVAREDHRGDGEGTLVLMGVMAAFVFAAQMINVTIPGTGSSGHLAGGTLLAVLLGPVRALICLAAVLLVQAFFFADGGLIALGCNIFNLGLVGALVGWSLYRLMAGPAPGSVRRSWSAGVAAWAATVVGSAMVPVQTTLSGRADLPFLPFLGGMSGIHAGIGVLEGLVTAGVVTFLLHNRPALFGASADPDRRLPTMRLLLLGGATLLIAGVLFLYASERPDGLEFTVGQHTEAEPAPTGGVMAAASRLQERTSFMADYGHRLAGLVGVGLLFIALTGGLWFLRLARAEGRKGEG